jgi:hypothetical protein
MVLIDGDGPGTVAMDVILSFYFSFILFYHISVSGQSAQFKGDFRNNKGSGTSTVAPIIMAPHCP